MKFFEITLKPLSKFGTSLKGDTLFGHFCWQVEHDSTLVNNGIETQIKMYKEKPFAVFSSAFPKVITNNLKEYYALKVPNMPANMFFKPQKNRLDILKQAKENKKKKWMLVEKNSTIELDKIELITEKQLCEIIVKNDSEEILLTESQQHNTINRLTNTTGEGQFAPYITESSYYIPGIILSIFVTFNEDAINIKQIIKGLERIGSWGFGRDASTGSGRFAVCNFEEMKVDFNNQAFYTLAPSVPDASIVRKSYLTVFTRFGKHGDRLVYSKNPFKNPVIMADEASVFIIQDKKLDKPYMGSAVLDVSKVMPEAVVQGYTPCLPIKLEQNI